MRHKRLVVLVSLVCAALLSSARYWKSKTPTPSPAQDDDVSDRARRAA
jgi:hypothetical protein